MTFQLIGLLSAAALAATNLGAAETRSAQSLPAQNLALVQSTASSGKLAVRHLADASDVSDAGSCERGGGHWDNDHCRKGWGDGVKLLILAGTAAGIAVAVTESNHHSVSN